MSGGICCMRYPSITRHLTGLFVLIALTGSAALAGSQVGAAADWGIMNRGVPPGTNGVINSIVRYGKNIYVAGTFNKAGGVQAVGIAKWDGVKWDAIGPGIDDGNPYMGVSAMTADKAGNLYVCGTYWINTPLSSVLIFKIKKWDGAVWNTLNIGDTDEITSMAVDASGNLYVGGPFHAINGIAAAHIARWNGSKWDTLGSGISPRDGTNSAFIHAMTVDNSGNLYVGGIFGAAGGIHATCIAKWNGSAWDSLKSGVGGSVNALLYTKGKLYVGGYFDQVDMTANNAIPADNIALWDGSNWSAVGIGVYGMVNALTIDSNNILYAGGSFFPNPYGLQVGEYNIAKWDGTKWYGLALGSPYGSEVSVLMCYDNATLYAGGTVELQEDLKLNNIGKWNGTKWEALGTGMDGTVSHIAFDKKGVLFAGGNFTTSVDDSTRGAAKWDGSKWSGLHGRNLAGLIYAFSVDGNGNVYVGGIHNSSVIDGGLIKWDGSAWSAMALEQVYGWGEVTALATDAGGNLFVSEFGQAVWNVNAPIRHYTGEWNGSAWHSLGSGLNFGADAFVPDNSGSIYACGSFTLADSIPAMGIAKWDGNGWSALGSGIWGMKNVLALDKKSNLLYVGGNFDSAGETAARNIAMWNGTKWSALGPGLDSTVYALAVDGAGNLYAGGSFATAGGAPAKYLAQWNGTAWNALVSGVDSTVRALAIHDSTLFVGGDFSFAGGKFTPYIANLNIHKANNPVIPVPAANTDGIVHFRLNNFTLRLINIAPLDKISFFTLAGRCLREVQGISMVNLNDISPQPIIIRIKRAGKMILNGIVLLQK
jgi:trimeric autotransporter adhesin